MSTVKINFEKQAGKINIMHAVNNGPCVAGPDQTRGNQDDYKAARIPYARTHDASFFAGYGGEHTVDIRAIFPNFDADVNDPESYDFACTDVYMRNILKYGSKPFYRLGSRIEHEVRKYGTLPPKDFQKWAEICEHIISHYTEGWANGYNYDMEYWEIWNEPDLDPDDSKNKRCWGGTEAEFARLFIIAAKHLKNRFPHLKIGGPALAGNEEYLERLLARAKAENTPLDFVSWHWYWTEPTDLAKKCVRVRDIMNKCGYENAESICNEWNYVRGWTDEFVYSIEQIISMKGAAFTAACMSACENTQVVDMLMYYDARPTAFNGLFDMYTYRPLKGYYPFVMYSRLYELGAKCESSSDDEDVYVVSATDGKTKRAMITYYAEDDNKSGKIVYVDMGCTCGAKVFVTDKDSTMREIEPVVENGQIKLRLQRNSIVLIEQA
ncbi:MAG: hypothetical protein IJ309_03035 [Clostridia bacterium]|nr:hypothetical protein [Clostridia bacterium]